MMAAGQRVEEWKRGGKETFREEMVYGEVHLLGDVLEWRAGCCGEKRAGGMRIWKSRRRVAGRRQKEEEGDG